MNATREILRQRAAEAAKPLQQEHEVSNVIDVIRFTVGNEIYALETALFNEVVAYREPMPVPHVPSYILGIVYRRGRFVSVVDLQLFLGIEGGENAGQRSLLLLNDGTMEFGVAVDGVLEETRIARDAIQPTAPGFAPGRSELIAGVTEEGTIVMDGKRFLGDASMTIHQEVATSYQRGTHV